VSIRDELVDVIAGEMDDPSGACQAAPAVLAHLAERGMVVLGPDGEPIDVRPALRALGLDAWLTAANGFQEDVDPHGLGYNLRAQALTVLEHQNITGPLADAGLAAEEVEP